MRVQMSVYSKNKIRALYEYSSFALSDLSVELEVSSNTICNFPSLSTTRTDFSKVPGTLMPAPVFSNALLGCELRARAAISGALSQAVKVHPVDIDIIR